MAYWIITCKCGASAAARLWLDSHAVLTGKCHFQCPACGVMIRRKARGAKQIDIAPGVSVFVPEDIVIEEVQP
jgi:hypothetical protein